MRSGPEVTPEAAVESIATDPTSLTLSSDMTTASADVPVGGEVETTLWRRENAALAHAARLRAKGWPVAVSHGIVTWESRPKRRPVEPPAEPITEHVADEKGAAE